MNRTRLIAGLAFAVVLGLFASWYVYRQFSRMAEAKPVASQQIVVAAVKLPLGTRLQPQQLRTIAWPVNEPLAGSFTRVEDCVGRAPITQLEENEIVLEAKLAPKEAGAGLSATIPEGMRGLSVAVNDVVGVAGFVLPGTMVDVLVTGSVSGNNTGQTITQTILENIRVLAAGQKIEQDKDGKPQTVPVITLLVTPEEASKLAMASSQGRIQLALRNTVDTKKVSPPPVWQASLFGAAEPAKPRLPRTKSVAPPAPPSYSVEVIFGTKRETKTFADTSDH